MALEERVVESVGRRTCIIGSSIFLSMSNFEHIIIGDLKSIDEKTFAEAKGIAEEARNDTNHGLALRDYSQNCYYPEKIGVFHGWHIWWCDTHFQPHFVCERVKFQRRVTDFAQAVDAADKTESYDYGGDDAKNRNGVLPASGQRWLSPRELARDFLAWMRR